MLACGKDGDPVAWNRIELVSDDYTAWILPERGGSCVRLARYGAEALRTPDSEDSYRQNEFLWGTPVLFFPNRISGGSFEFEGRTYRLPVNEKKTGCFLHGTLHRTKFEVVEQSETEAVLRYEATEEKPYLTFPHCFAVTLRGSLSADGLRQQAAVENASAFDMPVALAFHTTFRIPFSEGSRPEQVSLTLDTQEEYGRDMETFLPDGRAWKEYPDKRQMERGDLLPSEHTISRLFRMDGRHEMCLTDLRARIRVRYKAGEAYHYWMVYNGGRQDLLCVEPQSWLSNCPNAPFPREISGFDFIMPGEKRVYETWMRIERIV